MTNVIWQTRKDDVSVLSDETIGQLEFIDKVLLKNVEHTHHFDNKQYKTFINNSIIIYSAPLIEIDGGLRIYLDKYKSLGYKFILFHLSDEFCQHNCYYYPEAEHVFRFHYDYKIKHPNVTVLPLGYTTGYMNKDGVINMSDKRDITTTFIGQVKTDRQEMLNAISGFEKKIIYLTRVWSDPNIMTFDKVIDIYKRVRFVPCPMGNISPETLRLYEALEWGAVPIVKKHNGTDYYKYIFGEHPIPMVENWSEAKDMINKLNTDGLDSLIMKINTWYKKIMNDTSVKVANIINEKLKNNN